MTGQWDGWIYEYLEWTDDEHRYKQMDEWIDGDALDSL